MNISFIIPFFNESKYLFETLDSINKQRLDDLQIEVLLINGMSKDDSKEIAMKFINENQSSNIFYRLMENEKIKTAYAFNLGIKESKAEIIGFGGSHTIYPENYIRIAYDLFLKINADVIGGGHNNYVPDKSTFHGEAMACLYRSPIGSGVASYHRKNKPGYVDTVYGGFYKKEIFNDIGGFNTSLVKNQDNEFNARVLSSGYKIYYDPSLSTKYIQKTDLKTYLTRPFLFGKYHITTWIDNPKAFRLRHAIPGIFLIYLMLLLFLMLFDSASFIYFFPMLVYLSALLINAIYFSIIEGILVGLFTIPLFFIYHISYGIGTILGIFIKKNS